MKFANYLNSGIKQRGIRNNNPTNIVKTKISWKGEIPIEKRTEDFFEQFENVGYGIRAGFLNMFTKIKKGHNTPELFIKQWAPASHNGEQLTNGYIDTFAKALGISPTQKMPLNRATYLKAMRTIVDTENGATAGRKYVTDDVIAYVYDNLGILEKFLPSYTTKGTGTIIKYFAIALVGLVIVSNVD